MHLKFSQYKIIRNKKAIKNIYIFKTHKTLTVRFKYKT